MTLIKNILKMTKVVSLVLILILFTWLLHKPKTIKNNIQNNTNQSKSNLQTLIDQANHIFIIENFVSNSPPQKNPADAMEIQLETPPSPAPTTSIPTTTSIESYEPEEPSSDIHEIISKLDNLEERCNNFEERQTTKFKDEQQQLQEEYRIQLDLETEKINQLKDIVSYYKRQYDTKLKLNTQCRKETGLQLDEDIKTVQNDKKSLKSKKVVLELNK